MPFRLLAAACLIAVVACEQQPTRRTPRPRTQAPVQAPAPAKPVQLIPYEIIEQTESMPYKMSYEIRVDLVDGRLPTEAELGAISQHLKSAANRTFVAYYLPGMTPGAGAFATAHHKPDMTVEILPYFVPEKYQPCCPEPRAQKRRRPLAPSACARHREAGRKLGRGTRAMRRSGAMVARWCVATRVGNLRVSLRVSFTGLGAGSGRATYGQNRTGAQ